MKLEYTRLCGIHIQGDQAPLHGARPRVVQDVVDPEGRVVRKPRDPAITHILGPTPHHDRVPLWFAAHP